MRFRVLVIALLVAGLVCGIKILEVKGQVYKKAREIHLIMVRAGDVQQDIERLEAEKARLSTPAELAGRAKKFGLPIAPRRDPALEKPR